MSKSKGKETVTTSQNKTFREKLELVKKKSLFAEDVMKSLEARRNQYDFILKCFKRSLQFLPIPTGKAESIEEIREWSGLSSLKEAVQPMTQEEMETLWQSFEQSNKDDDEYITIDFEKGNWVWNGSSLFFRDATIEIKPVSMDPLKGTLECFNLHANNHLKGTIYLWDKQDDDCPAQGVLKAVDESGKTWFFELEHFSMVSLSLTQDANDVGGAEDKPSQVTTAEGETESGEVSAPDERFEAAKLCMFILFNKSRPALFTTTF